MIQPASQFALIATLAVAHATSIDSIISAYTAYERMTPRPVPLNPIVAEACVRSPPIPAIGPHDRTWVTVFMNASASDAFATYSSYPPGSVVIKRKEDDAGLEVALAGMIKRRLGFDPSNNDWEFFYRNAGEKRASTAGLEGCGDCHVRAADTDFVFGDWDSPVAP